jgi:hypothetical protein
LDEYAHYKLEPTVFGVFGVVGDPNHVCCLSTNSNDLHVFLLCWEYDPCSLYLGAMITGMGIFIECGYGSHMGIDAATLTTPKCNSDLSWTAIKSDYKSQSMNPS